MISKQMGQCFLHVCLCLVAFAINVKLWPTVEVHLFSILTPIPPQISLSPPPHALSLSFSLSLSLSLSLSPRHFLICLPPCNSKDTEDLSELPLNDDVWSDPEDFGRQSPGRDSSGTNPSRPTSTSPKCLSRADSLSLQDLPKLARRPSHDFGVFNEFFTGKVEVCMLWSKLAIFMFCRSTHTPAKVCFCWKC